MDLKTKNIKIPRNKRLVCISDIHGDLNLFKRLLEKIGFCGDNDILIILGDFYLKGKQEEATFCFVMQLSQNPNVHILR